MLINQKSTSPAVVRGFGTPSHLCKPLSPFFGLVHSVPPLFPFATPPHWNWCPRASVYKDVKCSPLLVSVCCATILFVLANDLPRIPPSSCTVYSYSYVAPVHAPLSAYAPPIEPALCPYVPYSPHTLLSIVPTKPLPSPSPPFWSLQFLVYICRNHAHYSYSSPSLSPLFFSVDLCNHVA